MHSVIYRCRKQINPIFFNLFVKISSLEKNCPYIYVYSMYFDAVIKFALFSFFKKIKIFSFKIFK